MYDEIRRLAVVLREPLESVLEDWQVGGRVRSELHRPQEGITRSTNRACRPAAMLYASNG
jgi:hypothetical protein